MKDKIFYMVLALITIAGIAVTAAMLIHSYNLFQSISIVEMIANWGY